jgi:hypothetical protein
MQDHAGPGSLPSVAGQSGAGGAGVLRLLDKHWQSVFAARAAWQDDPAPVLGRPTLPGDKDQQQGRTRLVYTMPALSIPA